MTAQSFTDKVSPADKTRLEALWQNVAAVNRPPPETATAQALALGVNFRIHLIKAFQAAWETSKVIVKGTAVAHAPFDIFAWLDVGIDLVGAVEAIFAALVQRMRPIDYVTCVILANHPNGMTPDELSGAVRDFLSGTRADEYAWYLGMNQSRVTRAKEVLANEDWFETVLEKLRETEFLDERQKKLLFRSHDFNLGWRKE